MTTNNVPDKVYESYRDMLKVMEGEKMSTIEVMATFLTWTIAVAKHHGMITFMPRILRVTADHLELTNEEPANVVDLKSTGAEFEPVPGNI